MLYCSSGLQYVLGDYDNLQTEKIKRLTREKLMEARSYCYQKSAEKTYVFYTIYCAVLLCRYILYYSNIMHDFNPAGVLCFKLKCP